MLKIQLLDRRFFAAGRIKRMLVLCLLLTAVLVAGILWNTKRLQTRAADMQAQAAAAALDEALELGVRMKRWSPDAQPLEGSPAA